MDQLFVDERSGQFQQREFGKNQKVEIYGSDRYAGRNESTPLVSELGWLVHVSSRRRRYNHPPASFSRRNK
ncbi:MAG: hypothetical protein ACKVI3_09310, partial [Verrucomicrobiia bacterium]